MITTTIMNKKRISLGTTQQTRFVVDRLAKDIKTVQRSVKNRGVELGIKDDPRINLQPNFKNGNPHPLEIIVDRRTHITFKRIAGAACRTVAAHAREVIIQAIKDGGKELTYNVKGIDD